MKCPQPHSQSSPLLGSLLPQVVSQWLSIKESLRLSDLKSLIMSKEITPGGYPGRGSPGEGRGRGGFGMGRGGPGFGGGSPGFGRGRGGNQQPSVNLDPKSAQLVTNNWKINFIPKTGDAKQRGFHKYEINFRNFKTEPSKAYRRELWQEWFKLYSGSAGYEDPNFEPSQKARKDSDYNKLYPVFDGDKAVYTVVQFPPMEQQHYSFNLPVVEGQTAPPAIYFKLVETQAFKPLGDLIYRPDSVLTIAEPKINRSLTALNLFLGHFAFLEGKFVREMGKWFEEDDRRIAANSRSGGVEFLRGFVLSVRPTLEKLVLSVDITSGAFFPKIPVEDLINDMVGNYDTNKLDEHRKREVNKRLGGLKITYDHPQLLTPKIHRVHSLGSSAHNTSFTFDGKTMTVFQYFKGHQKITLDRPNKGVLKCYGRKKDEYIYLPVEFCKVEERQMIKLKLSPREQQGMISFATMRPAPTFRTLQAIVNRNFVSPTSNAAVLQQLGLSVSKQPEEAVGKIMSNPVALFSNNVPMNIRNGRWNISRSIFFAPPSSKKMKDLSWVVVDFANQEQHTRNFVEQLQLIGKQKGIPIQAPSGRFSSPSSNIGVVRKALEKAMKAHNPQLLLCILPPGDNKYGGIKTILDQAGIPSQCVLAENIQKTSDQFASNVLLKINAKLGGLSHVVDLQSCVRSKEHPQPKLMIIGADLTHGSPGEVKPSVSALVASMDPYFMRFKATYRAQELAEPSSTSSSERPKKKEMIQGMEEMMLEVLEEFYKINKCLPTHLVFFRDGVSESELEMARKIEISAVQRAAASISQKHKLKEPDTIFIVCTKRHRHKFAERVGDEIQNARAGTLLDNDSGLATKGFNEYYLVSHGGTLGTSRSTRYILLEPGATKLFDWESADGKARLQNLTNSLCSGSQRSTASLGVTLPVFYADLVCTRIRFWMDEVDAEKSRQTEGSQENQERWGTAESRKKDLLAYQAQINQMKDGVEKMESIASMWWM